MNREISAKGGSAFGGKKINYFRFGVSLSVPLLAGFLGSIFTRTSVSNWYLILLKPTLNPPSWVFGPVWTLLYILMGISLYLIWQKKEEGRKIFWAVYIFYIQLLFNIIWSILFFSMRTPEFALWEIFFLWVLIFLNIIAFARISKKAAWLLVPYLAWVTFAIYLNWWIFVLN